MEFCTDLMMTWKNKETEKDMDIKFDIAISNFQMRVLIDKLKDIGNRRFILYPAGQVARNVLQQIDLQDKNLIGVGDTNKQGKFYGQKIYSPDEIPLLNIEFILICSFAFEDEIYTELKKRIQNTSIEILRIMTLTKEEMDHIINSDDKKISALSKKSSTKSTKTSTKEVVFISHTQPSHLCYRYSYVLKKKYGYKTTLFYLGVLDKEHRIFLEPGFDTIIEIDSYSLLIELFMKYDGSLFHVNVSCWGLNILYYILKVRNNQKVIWDVYDFLEFYSSFNKESILTDFYIYNHYIQYIYKHIDAIIYQDDPNGVTKYVKEKINTNIPFLHFDNLVLDDFMINSKELYKRKPEPYKVNYAGNIEQYRESFNNIIESGCSMEVFQNPCLIVNKSGFNTNGINFHESVYPPQLQKSISFCNYALLTSYPSFSKHSDYSFTQKFIVNLEAGLPMIASDTYKYMANLVNKHNVGIVCTLKELKEVKKILEHKNYVKYTDNIIKARCYFSLYNNIHKIEELYSYLKYKTISGIR